MAAEVAGGVCTKCHRALDDHSWRDGAKWLPEPKCPVTA